MKKYVFLSVTVVTLLTFVNASAAPSDTVNPPKAHKTTLNTKNSGVQTKKTSD